MAKKQKHNRHVKHRNAQRKYLTASQRALIAAYARDAYEQQARQRRLSGLRQGNAVPVLENLPGRDNGNARDLCGATMGVSGRMVDYASKVLRHAEPEVQEAVAEGRMAVDIAAVLAEESPGTQRQEVKKPKVSRQAIHGLAKRRTNGLGSMNSRKMSLLRYPDDVEAIIEDDEFADAARKEIVEFFSKGRVPVRVQKLAIEEIMDNIYEAMAAKGPSWVDGGIDWEDEDQ